MASQIKEQPMLNSQPKIKVMGEASETKSIPNMVGSIRNSTTLSTYKDNEMRIMNDDSGMKDSPEIKFSTIKKQKKELSIDPKLSKKLFGNLTVQDMIQQKEQFGILGYEINPRPRYNFIRKHVIP